MPEVSGYRETRTTYARDSSPSDDEYKRTTVRRYKVTPDRAVVERVERDVDVIDVDRRTSRYSGRADLLDIEPRMYVPERPRSAFEPSARDRDERYSRVDRVEYRDEGHRGALIERERVVERDDDFYSERDRGRGGSSRVVYESSKDIERDAYSPRSPRDYERRSYWDAEKDAEVRIEKRVERREDGAEVRIERRVEERRDDSVERWRKETEYYEPAPPPIVNVIRQSAPMPLVVRNKEEETVRELVASHRPHHDDEYYYRREAREVGPYIKREEEVTIEHYDDRHHHHHHRRHHHHSHSHRRHSDASDDEYYIKKTTVRRDSSGSPHRKRHIAEGALAGAGLSAILASRRTGNGELPENRGRKVLAGAALGALGTEVVRRAHSAYEERYGDEERDREYEKEKDKPHSRIKTGLGIAAVALAAAGAAKYYQSNKIEKEEMSRGRARHRSRSSGSSSRSTSRKRSKSRASSIAKAAAGTAAVAGLVQHYRHKRSKSRDGKSRSRSRLRTGAEIVAAGLAGAGAKKLYDKRKEKKERERSSSTHSRGYSSADDYARDDRSDRSYRRRDRSRSVTRSGPTHPDAYTSPADRELGMVEYGTQPLPPHEYGAGDRGYESAAEENKAKGEEGA
jgi:hypothetical protein